MDVSFSANTWRVNEIQSISLKREQEFYASTPYNLNDFKDITKPPAPLFRSIETGLIQDNHCVKKQLIKKQNISIAIFVTYLQEFLHHVIQQIQKNSNQIRSFTKLPIYSHQNLQKLDNQDHDGKQSDRRLIEAEKNLKDEDFQVLKSLKLKIYDIDLCRLKNIPPKFSKYYTNNLLKKIIFQYLSKVLYNESLVQILLENNELLCFALSLISQSLLCRKQIISSYNQTRNFYDQACAFLQYFDVNQQSQSSPIKSANVLTSSLTLQSKINQKPKSSQEIGKIQNFLNFSLSKNSMKSKHASLKEQDSPEKGRNYFLYLVIQKPASSTKVSEQKISETKSPKKVDKRTGSEGSKKSIGSKRYFPPGSNPKIKKVENEPGWLKYLGCLRYFFVDSPQK